MAAAVYIACTVTSLFCAVLLLRGYLRDRSRLLLWAVVCFLFLTLSNAVLFVDVIVLTKVDLFLPRNLPALVGLAALLVGLVWELR
jgi:hypothetical protein